MPTDPVPATPTGKPIVFYSPHQDDETLFMAQVIAHHALAGREVHVVLCSNGASSGARAEINGDTSDGTYWKGYHYPAREGYTPLTLDTFSEARTREFVSACAQLGVPASRVHLGRADAPAATSPDLPDTISTGWATQVMQSYADEFAARGWPSVGHYTMWWGDNHPDHANLGAALATLHAQDPDGFGDVRWTVKPEQVSAAGASAYGLPSTLATEIVQMARRAGWCYRAWQPASGAFATGYHSVSYFSGPENGTANHYVRP